MYFLGFAISGVLLQFIGQMDRRRNIIIFISISVVFEVLLTVVAEQYTRYVSLVLMGIGLVGFMVSFALITELVPVRNVAIVTASMMSIDDVINGIFPSVYFLWISKDWRWFYYFILVTINLP